MGECHERRIASGDFSIEDEIRRLSDLKEQWLGTPNSEFSGRIPGRIIEMERRRINMTMSAQECLLDDDCPICVSMSEDFDTPMFWFLDGCNMDERFEFSFFKTRAEWDKEQRRFEEYNREFEEKWAKRSESGEPFQFDEDPF